MTIREAAWKCPSCGKARNRGPAKFCSGCGKARGDDAALYLPSGARVVDSREETQRARAGADWRCSYCGGDNRASYDFCDGCGAPGEGAAKRKVIDYRDEAAPRRKKRDRSRRRKRRGCGCGCLLLLVLFFLALLTLGSGSESKELTVTGFRWQQTVQVEELETVRKKAWKDEVPEGARILESHREVRRYEEIPGEYETRRVTERARTGTEKVKVGVRDLGNGYFEDIYEDRPVYGNVTREKRVRKRRPVHDQRLTIEIEEWRRSREERLSGQDRPPRLPDPDLRAGERVGSRQASFRVQLKDRGGKLYTYRSRNGAEWRRYRRGASCSAETRSSGFVRRLDGCT